MTVHEIVKWLANGDDSIDLPTVERDIRSTVIREASVGKVSIKHVISVGNFVDDEHITFSKQPQDRHWLDYDLIPHKETS